MSIEYCRMMARYNTAANRNLYEVCSRLSAGEYRKERQGSFRSIERTLHHVFIGDRIWLGRFQGSKSKTPALDTILYPEFPALREARAELDREIDAFAQSVESSQFQRPVEYTNSKGIVYRDDLLVAVAHMFNHATHHRGQVHVMLSQTEIAPCNLDLHRIINP